MSSSTQKNSKPQKAEKPPTATKFQVLANPGYASAQNSLRTPTKGAISSDNIASVGKSSTENFVQPSAAKPKATGKISDPKGAGLGRPERSAGKSVAKARSLAEQLFTQENFEAVAEVPPHIYKMLFGSGRHGGLAAEKIAGACTLEGNALILDFKGDNPPIEISFEKSPQPMMYFCPSVKQDGNNSTLDREEQTYSALGLPVMKAHLRAKMSESDLIAEMTTSKPSRASPPARQTMTIPKEQKIDRSRLPPAKMSLSVQERGQKRQTITATELKDEIFDLFEDNDNKPLTYKFIMDTVDQPPALVNSVIEQICIRKKEGLGTTVYLKDHFSRPAADQGEESLKNTKQPKR